MTIQNTRQNTVIEECLIISRSWIFQHSVLWLNFPVSLYLLLVRYILQPYYFLNFSLIWEIKLSRCLFQWQFFSSLYLFWIFLEVQSSCNNSLYFPLYCLQHLPCFKCQSRSLLLLWFPCCISSLQAVTDGVFWCGLPIFSHFQQHFLNLIVPSNSLLLQNPHWPLLVFCNLLFGGTAPGCTLAMKPQQSQLPFHAKGFQYLLLQPDARWLP